MFQMLLDNMAVKMKQLWVCGFSNFFEVSVTSFDILNFCARHMRSIWCTYTSSFVNAGWLTFLVSYLLTHHSLPS